MKFEQWVSILGLANRARKIISGEELVVKDVRSQKAKLVILSEDASENTRKKISDKCKHYKVPLRTVKDRYILGHAIGKEARVTVAVLEKGFADKLMRLLDETTRG